MKEKLVEAIADLREGEALELARAMLDAGQDPFLVLEAGKAAMSVVGERFERQEYFLPELIIAGELLEAIGDLAKPKLRAEAPQAQLEGKVVIGTVAGDIHDIGKNIVSFMLDANNFEVHDIGVDVPAAKFVEAIVNVKPDVVGMSGFLTLAYDQMRATVQAIEEAGLRDSVKIMIGGSVLDESAAEYVGADAYGKDALHAVNLAKTWTGGK
jgi:5-methyltetrahydrofolate--homocysteine methyltransferase